MSVCLGEVQVEITAVSHLLAFGCAYVFRSAIAAGGMGRMPLRHLMALALAHAGKLQKFGA